ncbi:hypothetical protein E4633_11830 [Geomonas terrae]|uniref:Response regulatory domain-containing protein n=1 Tax=Geomonas terrae TaxID=2562681 RepID=A0A4S1CCB6_9BACT|nr:hypothetical protein [Geomonas terrae]TGU71034.1 hypothetical protein E4633_11830 [Geomonas terrae]
MKNALLQLLSPEKLGTFSAVKKHAEALLDHSAKFKYFTLHGKVHIDNMLKIASMLVEHGVGLNEREAYLLALSICIHDLGMVVPLSEKSHQELFQGRDQATDSANVEAYIRETHNELVKNYVDQNFSFLSALGISASDCGLLVEIARSHRKTQLATQAGFPKKIGALLRIIDELDIGPERAPISVLRSTYKEMDGTSCWHWFKHNIVDEWDVGHNVFVVTENTKKTIIFKLIVRPPTEKSIAYWLHQIRRPIIKVLIDENSARIVNEEFGVMIRIEPSQELSKANLLDTDWKEIEEISLSHGRKTILLADDEVRKMEDLMLPLMAKYHIIFSPNANDAVTKLAASKIDLAIVDMQIGSNVWTAEETDNYKATGLNLIKHITAECPETKIGILTGTRHELSGIESYKLAFFLKKPVDPEVFERTVEDVLG